MYIRANCMVQDSQWLKHGDVGTLWANSPDEQKAKMPVSQEDVSH